MKNRIYNILIFIGLFFLITEQLQAKKNGEVMDNDTTIMQTLRFMQDNGEMNMAVVGNRKTESMLDSIMGNSSKNHFLQSLSIVSFGLPEADKQVSSRLVSERVESVKRYLSRRYPHLDNMKIVNMQADAWTEIRRRVISDSEVEDKGDVLALIDFHRNNPGRLLQRLNGRRARELYDYLGTVLLQTTNELALRIDVSIPVDIKEVSPVTVEGMPVAETLSDREAEKRMDQVLEPDTVGEVEVSYTTVLALKNNILYDLALSPNIEIELPLGRRWSLNTEYKCPWWVNGNHKFCYQLLSGGIEARCWLGNRKVRSRLTGHFIGLYGEGGIYDFQFGGDGYQGKYYGASGLTYGYVRQLSRGFALEFSLGVGYLTTEYRKYTPYEEDLVWTSSGRYNFIGPTKAKISLVWFITTKR